MKHKTNLVRSALLLLLGAAVAMGQSDRGTLTGTVKDPADASVPAAKLVLRNTETGVLTDAQTTPTGDYTFTSIPVGTYDLTVQAPGFKAAVQKQIIIRIDQTARVDIRLEVGSSTESVTVEANAEMLKTDNAEVSTIVSGETLNELPINFGGQSSGGGIRNWLTFTYLAPGVAGTSATSEVNGLPGSNYKVYLEGQDSTSPVAVGWTSTVQSASVEAITEFAVQSSNYSAEYGQVLGGLYNFTTKSGTNGFHGSVYEEFTNEAFNAALPWDHVLNRDRQSDYGGTIGGPVWIPKIYNGHNRTFFFFNLEGYSTNATSVLNGTVPTTAYRQGDFSCALYVTSTNCTGPTVTLTDPTSGYSYLQNQIFDPASTYTDSKGRLIRNAFPNNMIPLTRMDPVALKIQALLPAAQGTQTTSNWNTTIVTPTKQRILSLKLDQNFGAQTKLSGFWNRMSTNSPAYADGLPFPITGVRKTVGGTVGGDQFRINLDHTFSPTLIGHLGVGWWRFKNPDSSAPDILNYNAVGLLGLTGSANNGLGFPNISGLSYNNEGGMADTLGIQNSVFQQTDIASSVGSMTWVHGIHTWKAGFELKDSVYSDQSNNGVSGNYSFSGAETAIPFLGTTTVGSGSIGSGYASFLLGAVQNYKVSPPQAAQQRSIQEGLYLTDNMKLTSRLTFEIGLRYDRTPLGHEEWDRQSEISFSTPDPNAGNLPGGTIFAGYGAGRCNCEFVKTYNFGFAPRLSVAYEINPKTVIRAGWGLSYATTDQWNYLSNNYLTNGMGYTTISPGNNPQFGYAYSQLQTGIAYDPSSLHVVNLNAGINSPVGALGSPSASAITYDPTGARPSRVNQWNVTLQRKLSATMSLQAAYVGNRGVWEQLGGLVNPNALSPAILKAHNIDLTNAATRTLMTSQICSAAAVAAGFSVPYAGFPCTATVAQSLRPYPEYSVSLAPQFADQGDSFYDSLQVGFTKRLSHGLDITSNYTFAKTENIGGYINADPTNRTIQKGLDSSDFPNIFVTALTYVTPKATSNKLVRTVTGGWTFGTTLRYASGSLIAAPQSVADKWSTYTFASGTVMTRVPGAPLFLIDPNCRCIDPNNINQRVLNPAAWQDVAAGTISPGSGYYNDYRGPHQVNENVNFGRTFQIREKMSLNIRAEFFNPLNRVALGTPNSSNPLATTTVNNATGSISGFGYYAIGNTSSSGSPRVGLLVARFRF